MDALSACAASKSLHMWQHPLGTDKEWPHNYLSGLYSRKFLFEHQIHSILEIGIAHCASLALWSNAFPEAEIIGVDINECTQPHPEFKLSTNISTILADAYSETFVSKLDRRFDLIIDDGPHSLESQIDSLRLYSGLLDSNGMLIIEDVANGLRTARTIRSSCDKANRKNLVFYDFRSFNNHFDNCLVVYYESKFEARAERRLSSYWDQFAFAFPIQLPSKFALSIHLRKVFNLLRFRVIPKG